MKLPTSAAGRTRTAIARGLRRVRRALWRRRFVVAAACCGLAATLTVQVLRPAPPPATDVVLLARPVVAGQELVPDDVAVRPVARELVPPGSLTSVADAVGRVAVARLPAGVPMHAALAVEQGIGAHAPPGTVVVPVRLADPAVSGLLRAGDRVDLVAVDDGFGTDGFGADGFGVDGFGTGATTGAGSGTSADSGASTDPAPPYLARRALVLPLPEAPETVAGGLLGPATAESPAVTLVAVSPAEAPLLSAVSSRGTVAAVLVP
ncbi:SAF domain-containing protein [Antribacter gilvus]|uniref:SAF domain-containing protein n=1 Tax=Antribacter gilvus TaxID=2304675 RepID=UPI000F7A844F|nr:SAF domain-containing protein [Antribacter gilvus]